MSKAESQNAFAARKIRKIRIPPMPRGLFVLAILVGPVIGLAVHELAVRVEQGRAQTQLERQTANAAFAIESELAADVEVLYALRSFFGLGAPVTRGDFALMARPILDRHPHLRALEWIPRVDRDERRTHEQGVRDEGLAGYTITEQSSTGALVPAGDRDLYYPVVFVEPVEGNERALGFDIGSDRLRRAAMDRAAATNKPAVTDPISLVQGTHTAKGVLGLLAVFEDGLETTEMRTEALRGFVLAVFDVEGLLQHAQLGPGSPVSSEIRFELSDKDVDGQLLLIHSSPVNQQQRFVLVRSAEQMIDLGGQRWLLVARPTSAYLEPLRTRQPLLLGAVAAIAWMLLVGLVAIFGARTRDRLERRHARLTKNILESLRDGVIVADTTGRILVANRAAIAISGKGPTDILPSAWSETFGLLVPGTDKLFPPDELPLARAIRGEVTDGVEVFVRNPEGPGGTYVSVSGAPMLSERGSVRGGVVVFRDISERKRAEERLQRLSSAVEQTADAVVITDHQGTIEYVNPAFEHSTGYSSAEAVGKNPNILKSGLQTPQFYRDLWATLLRGEAFRGTIVNRKKNGELYHAEQTITGIRNGDGQIIHFVSVLKDMTERHKIQHQEIELELASMVQRRLFPSSPPQIPGYDIAGGVFPAEATCGDYFDFVPLPNESLALVVADVSGHGLGPALVMAETRAYLRSAAMVTEDLAAITDAVNDFLVADLQENFFVTMLVARLEPHTGRFTYVNSDTPPVTSSARRGRSPRVWPRAVCRWASSRSDGSAAATSSWSPWESSWCW